MEEFRQLLLANIGPLLLSLLAIVLAYIAMRMLITLEAKRLEFEKERFAAESSFREEVLST